MMSRMAECHATVSGQAAEVSGGEGAVGSGGPLALMQWFLGASAHGGPGDSFAWTPDLPIMFCAPL